MILALALFGGVATWADCRWRALPGALLAAGALGALAWRLSTHTLETGFVGFAVLGGGVGLITLLSRGGFGWGDWAYSAWLGLLAGAGAGLLMWMAGMLLAALWTTAELWRTRRSGFALPLAPFLALGSCAVGLILR